MTHITETEYQDLLKRAGVDIESEYVDTGDLLEIIAKLQRRIESNAERIPVILQDICEKCKEFEACHPECQEIQEIKELLGA